LFSSVKPKILRNVDGNDLRISLYLTEKPLARMKLCWTFHNLDLEKLASFAPINYLTRSPVEVYGAFIG